MISQAKPTAPMPAVERAIGRIVSVSGARAIAMLNTEAGPGDTESSDRPEMGNLVKVTTDKSVVLGLVSALSVPVPATSSNEPEVRIVELELVGELPRESDGELGRFKHGVTIYPGLGDPVVLADRDVLEKAYAYHATDAICIGHLLQDDNIPSMVRVDDLLGKHFAILGTTGTGKSCSVALILRGIIEKSPHAHVVLLDPHSEYASSFGSSAEVITLSKLNLPFWLLNFEEIVEIFVGDHAARETDIEILSELIPLAKARYAASGGRDRPTFIQRQSLETWAYTVDTPVPYRVSDLMGLLQENIGKLDHQGALAPFKRIKNRVEQISRDPRYGFMFGNLTVQDTMVEVLSQVFRIPVNGKPITIIDLAGLPSEVVNVTVSVLSRMTFDFGLWSDGKIPITLICEEAHRYVPNDQSLGFEPTTRAISRIAKEGRKYGISLGVISQRPAELAPTILSQCNTIFAMRLSNEHDQEILRAAISDAASSLLEFLPSMGNREAIAFGEGVTLPARIRFNALSEDVMPQSGTREFTRDWSQETGDAELLKAIVSRWRSRTRAGASHAPDEQPQNPQAGTVGQQIAQEIAQQQDRGPDSMQPNHSPAHHHYTTPGNPAYMPPQPQDHQPQQPPQQAYSPPQQPAHQIQGHAHQATPPQPQISPQPMHPQQAHHHMSNGDAAQGQGREQGQYQPQQQPQQPGQQAGYQPRHDEFGQSENPLDDMRDRLLRRSTDL